MKKNTKRILTSSLIAAFALTTAFSVSTLLKPQAADFSDFTMNTGAGVRMDAPTGIRFTANVGESTKASLANATDVTFGMLIAPTLGEDGELTLEDVTDATVNAAKLVTQVWTDDNQTAYNGAIVGKVDGADFPTDKYGTSLNARGYVTYTLDNVTTTEYTTNTATRSLAQAAANSLANGVADPNDFLKGILTTVGAT
ncbi:MAG: hypothetical protein IJ514_01445, partial [Clostridia bacterium]|nr:hypothetical protein [Clostridia bacterium]